MSEHVFFTAPILILPVLTLACVLYGQWARWQDERERAASNRAAIDAIEQELSKAI